MSYQRLSNVQAMRGLAALLVLLAHLGGLGGIRPQLPTFNASWAVSGVDVFFVVSGFIMYHVTRNAWGNFPHFISSRAARIYPLWWICLIIEAPWIVNYFTGSFDEYFPYALRSLLLLPALNPGGELYPILVPGWTLMYEMFFYLSFALVMATQRRYVSVKILLIFVCCYVARSAIHFDPATHVFLSQPIYIEFIYGIVIGELAERRRLSGRVVGGLLLAACAAVTVFAVCDRVSVGTFDPMRFLYYGLPAAAVVALAIWLEGLNVTSPRALVVLGDASYSIYLTHEFVLLAVPDYLARLSFTLPGSASVAVVGLVAIGAGLLVYFCVENPMHKLARHVLLPLKRPPSTTAVVH